MSIQLDSTQETSRIKTTDKTLLGYKLTLYQDALFNYFIPSLFACILYILMLACDTGVIFQHYKDKHPLWAILTILFLFIPTIVSFIVIISDWDLWPEYKSVGKENAKWLLTKTLEHMFFPLRQLWRHGERMFWSIDAIICKDDVTRAESMENVYVPRDIELCVFLQSYLQALPQVLFQLYILMSYENTINKQTENIQVASIVLNLAKIAVTTTYFQRFKSQKLAGKQYPWFKPYKKNSLCSRPLLHTDSMLEFRRTGVLKPASEDNRFSSRTVKKVNSLIRQQRAVRRSSTSEIDENVSNTGQLLETNIDEVLNPKNASLKRNSSEYYLKPNETLVSNEEISTDRPTSSKNIYRSVSYAPDTIESNYSETDNLTVRSSEPNFDIKRVIHVKGMPEDDIAGKLIALIWWFTFLLARVLSITAFTYFFSKEAIYIIATHFIIVMAFLIYDVKSDSVNRGKALFFLFIGYIYIFCIIEFKIKFKKATFMYYGYFFLVFLENIVMCMIWFNKKLEFLQNDFWFRYMFYIIVCCSLFSFSSMVFYMVINKPQKVVTKSFIKT